MQRNTSKTEDEESVPVCQGYHQMEYESLIPAQTSNNASEVLQIKLKPAETAELESLCR